MKFSVAHPNPGKRSAENFTKISRHLWQRKTEKFFTSALLQGSCSELVLPFLSLFRPFLDFPDFSGIFPICSGMVRGFSRFVPLLFLGLLRAPTRNSPERVRDTIWTIPAKSGKHPGLETPRFSFSQEKTQDSEEICCDTCSATHVALTGHVCNYARVFATP